MVCGNQGYMHVFGVCVYCKLSFVSFTTLSTSHASSHPNLLSHICTPFHPNHSSLIQFVCYSSVGVSSVSIIMRHCFDVMFLECPSSLQDGESSLMWACWKGHAEVVRMLLSAGARVNHQREVSSTSPAQ